MTKSTHSGSTTTYWPLQIVVDELVVFDSMKLQHHQERVDDALATANAHSTNVANSWPTLWVFHQPQLVPPSGVAWLAMQSDTSAQSPAAIQFPCKYIELYTTGPCVGRHCAALSCGGMNKRLYGHTMLSVFLCSKYYSTTKINEFQIRFMKIH